MEHDDYPARFAWRPGDQNPPPVVFSPAAPSDFTQLRVLCARLRRKYGDAPSVKSIARGLTATGWTIHVARVNSSTIVGFVLVESTWRADGFARLLGFWVHPEILRPGHARYMLQLALLEQPAAPMSACFAPSNPAVNTLISNGWKNVWQHEDGRIVLHSKPPYRPRRAAERREPAEAGETGGAPREASPWG